MCVSMCVCVDAWLVFLCWFCEMLANSLVSIMLDDCWDSTGTSLDKLDKTDMKINAETVCDKLILPVLLPYNWQKSDWQNISLSGQFSDFGAFGNVTDSSDLREAVL
ncbi:hypothetical protein GOODEAATRI_028231 [Goodea atripinnis]|uniref:Uncharacterized protein n=1 Tax=Goodea atripinnis TaxID=208336 RepID=A0ABV0PSE1_9TELE